MYAAQLRQKPEYKDLKRADDIFLKNIEIYNTIN